MPWLDVIAKCELEKDDVTPVSIKGRELAVYDGQAGISVTSGLCTHGAARLADGYFDGRSIECPLHQGLFDCVSGKALAAPATRSLRCYMCRVQNGIIQIWVANSL